MLHWMRTYTICMYIIPNIYLYIHIHIYTPLYLSCQHYPKIYEYKTNLLYMESHILRSSVQIKLNGCNKSLRTFFLQHIIRMCDTSCYVHAHNSEFIMAHNYPTEM